LDHPGTASLFVAQHAAGQFEASRWWRSEMMAAVECSDPGPHHGRRGECNVTGVTHSYDSNDPAGDDVPHSILDRLRGTGVGTEDPNIVGDAGALDVAPGADPPASLTEELPPEEETPSERVLPSDKEPDPIDAFTNLPRSERTAGG
jgi:hypothetical protein